MNPELLQELANLLARGLVIVKEIDAQLYKSPCQCGPCVEARSCGVEMGSWVQP